MASTAPEPSAASIEIDPFSRRPVRPIRMIKAEADLREFHRWAGSRRLISRNVFDEGYAMHCLLTETFGELAPKPFRLIAPRGKGVTRGTLYGYAQADAEELQELSERFADPQQAKILPADSIQSKPMPDRWKAGLRLGFEVLARPVVRSRNVAANPADTLHLAVARRPRGLNRGKDVEIDAFQYEAAALGKGEMTRTREDVYADWLRKQLYEHGRAHLEEARLHSFQRTRAVRRRQGPAVEGPSALIRGSLIVGERDERSHRSFGHILRRGVGRHRAYGYGMLLLRPPKPAGGI